MNAIKKCHEIDGRGTANTARKLPAVIPVVVYKPPDRESALLPVLLYTCITSLMKGMVANIFMLEN